ncbi:putative trigger factor protein [Cardiosporidium cionae]|uniref:Trigger factor protein n=1 Tax=Cardiosporidium cionae TaxID=476202 RepID=A0ABQ7JDA2_9APIC|nr:putative trigger factor protein [Cardiosporidium cionae]|eukprot:KAF8822021.1 putative trigger factor protein [Cardiosporidium cionae]
MPRRSWRLFIPLIQIYVAFSTFVLPSTHHLQVVAFVNRIQPLYPSLNVERDNSGTAYGLIAPLGSSVTRWSQWKYFPHLIVRLSETGEIFTRASATQLGTIISDKCSLRRDRKNPYIYRTSRRQWFPGVTKAMSKVNAAPQTDSISFGNWENLSNYDVSIEKLSKSKVLLTLRIPVEVSQKYWDLAVRKMHSDGTLRAKNKYKRLEHDTAASLQGKKLAHCKLEAVQYMANTVIPEAVKNAGLRVIGKAKLVQPAETLIDTYTPDAPFKLEVYLEIWPEVQFVKPYIGLKLCVPTPPYPKDLMWNLTIADLASRYATIGRTSLTKPAQWDDIVSIRIKEVYKRQFDDTAGDKLEEFELLNNTQDVIMEQYWNPPGLCEGLLDISAGEERFISVDWPPAKNESSNKAAVETLLNDALFHSDQKRTLTRDEEKERQLLHSVLTEVFKSNQAAPAIPDLKIVLLVECIAVKNRIHPTLDDSFFIKLCNQTRDEVRAELEKGAQEEMEQNCQKARRGAAERALDGCVKIDFPETLLEERCRHFWNDQLERKQVMGVDVSDSLSESAYQNWKESAKKSIEQHLKMSFAMREIRQREGITVDEVNIMKDLLMIKSKVPMAKLSHLTEQLHMVKESEAVLDWLADHAQIEYYADDRPMRLSVDSSGTGQDGRTLEAYPAGASPERYREKRRKLLKDAELLLHLKNKLNISPLSSKT